HFFSVFSPIPTHHSQVCISLYSSKPVSFFPIPFLLTFSLSLPLSLSPTLSLSLLIPSGLCPNKCGKTSSNPPTYTHTHTQRHANTHTCTQDQPHNTHPPPLT